MIDSSRGLRACGMIAIALASGFPLPTAQAQTITSDGSLNTTVLNAGPNYAIVGGSPSVDGRNLFHSFSQFSIDPGGSATFNLTATPKVANIFSRVTGSDPSRINGLLQTANNSGPVSLFLLNPNGILFGPQALLNIGGSFGGSLVASTANRLDFADGSQFSTIAAPMPLLTVSVPIGLQLGGLAPITVQGSGHTLVPSDPKDVFGISALVQPTRPGLQLRPNNTLALVGGTVQMNNGVAAAAQGHVEVGAVTEGRVGIASDPKGWRLNYDGVQQFGDVKLTGRSLLDVSGVNAGMLQLQGRRVEIQDTSILLSQNIGPLAGGVISVSASDILSIQGSSATGQIRSGISSQSLGLGTGSTINIKTPKLSMAQGGGIGSLTYQKGQSGDIRIITTDLQIQGFAATNPNLTTAIATLTLGSGNSGNLFVDTDRLQISDGASLVSTTYLSAGTSGQIQVNAKDVLIQGRNPLSTSSSLSSSSFGAGNAGGLLLNAQRVRLLNGGSIAATAHAGGNAGQVVVNALESLEIAGRTNNNSSTLNSSALSAEPFVRKLLNLPDRPTGNVGRILISTPKLTVRNEGLISVRNNGAGKSGQLEINASQISVGDRSRISAEATSAGDAGKIKINADQLLLESGSSINSRSQGSGNGGLVDLTVNQLKLNGASEINAQTVQSDGGNVVLTVGQLIQLTDRSLISTSAGGQGNGGNLVLNAPLILGLGDSDIVANAFQGKGGNVAISTQGLFGLVNRDRRTPGNDITASSEFGVQGSVQVTHLATDPSSGLAALPETVIDAKAQVAKGCGASSGSSFVITGRGGVAAGPEQEQNYESWRDMRSFGQESTGVVAQISPSSNAPVVEATGWQSVGQNQIALVAGVEGRFSLATTCSARVPSN